MMRLIYIFLISSLTFSCFGQPGDSLNFSYWTPKSWFSGGKKLLHDNINKYKFNHEQVEQLVNDVKTSKVLGIYYKYDPNVHYGLIPTIKVYIRQNQSENFEDFLISMKRGIEDAKSFTTNFKYIDSPSTILIGQRKAFYASSTYSLKVQTGEMATVRTKFVGIPFGSKFLYITLLDNEKEDCTDIYKEVIEKISIE